MTATVDVAARRYETYNPATGELVATHATATDAEAAQLLDQAHNAFLAWRDVPLEDKKALFRKAAELFRERAPELGRQVTLEMGKPVQQAIWEAAFVGDMFEFVADQADHWLRDQELEGVPGHAKTIKRPQAMGVTLGIEPWNGPLYQAARALAPNLIAGNTVLLKPAEICAGSTLMIDEIMRDAGFPEHVYQTALVSTDQVATFIDDPRVRAVTLTGSDRAGSAVGELAGKAIKPVVLELGGSDAFIVLPSADLETAATTAAQARCVLGGQVCYGPKRVIVVGKEKFDEFVRIYVENFGAQVVGDGFDPETTLGPLSSEAAVEQLQSQYEDAIAKGAKVALEGGRVDRPGYFFKPAVLTDIPSDARVYAEEAFGPLGMIYQVDTAEEAIELANSSQYGLGGTVFGDEDEAFAVAERLDTGMTGINSFFGGFLQVPFGGTKRSGFGRELGPSAIDAFVNWRTIGFPDER